MSDFNVPHHEQKKSWHDIDDNRKKELEIGGGLLVGLGAIGAGYYAYHEHGKNEEEKKAQTWGLQAWIKDAEQRTRDYQNNGPQGQAITWILNDGHTVPDGAIVGGQEADGTPTYVARAYFEGGIQPGKVSAKTKKGGVIGYGGKEIDTPKYEILVGDQGAVRWVQTSGTLNPDNLGAQIVEGGREPNGAKLYIAQAPYRGAVVPGKAGPKLNGAVIAYGGDEHEVNEYAVLVYSE